MTNAISLDIAKNKNISLGLPQSTGIDLSVGSGSGGTSHTDRSNLFEIKTNGDIYKNGVKVL